MALLEPAAIELFATLTLKLNIDEKSAREHLAVLRELAELVQEAPSEAPASVTGHNADDRMLAAALAARAQILVTGDRKHLLPLESHQGVRILSPQALLAELST